MKREKFTDSFLTTSIGIGLVYSPALMGIFFSLLTRGKLNKLNFKIGDYLLIAAALWAIFIIFTRGFVGLETGLLFQYFYLWSLPIIFRLYRPTERTLYCFQILIYALFILDLGFNIYSFAMHEDLLGRPVDGRSGLGAVRNGGLFAHSFYSGGISTLAYAMGLCNKKFRFFAMTAVANLYLAGSFRLVIPLLILPFFLWRWQIRTRIVEILLILFISAVALFSVFLTSTFGDLGQMENPANNLRIFAWINAIDKISKSPFTGVGYPKSEFVGIDESIVDEALVAESWYLNAAITFGLPYLILRLSGFLYIFYGPRFAKRTVYEAILVPYILIDLVYGGGFEGILFYTLLWLIIEIKPNHVSMVTNTRSCSRNEGHRYLGALRNGPKLDRKIRVV